MKILQIVLIALLCTPLAAQQPTIREAITLMQKFSGKPLTQPTSREKFDAFYYRLELTLDFQQQQVQGHTLGRFNSQQQNLTTLTLDFNQNLTVDSVGGDAVDFTRNGDFLILKLKNTFNVDETVEVLVSYSGNPHRENSLGFVFDRMPNEDPYVWTLSEPFGARDWWPCKDTPADKVDSVDILVTVPPGYLVGSNGTLKTIKQNPNGWKTFHWQERYPIATYLVSLVAGPYSHFQGYYHYTDTDSILLDYYVFPEDSLSALTVFSSVPDYLEALSSFFGPYPFLKEKYGMAQFGWGGGMEHQTLTSVYAVNPGWTYLYVHELGHQWFGDMVTCASWHDIWLNEGFASYSEALFAEWAGYAGEKPGLDAYLSYMQTQIYYDDGTIFIADTSRMSTIFRRIVYDKASWVLHMLRKVMGDDAFFTALKDYLNDPRWTYGSVRTSNFQEICERVSGLNLDSFFDQWLNYPYYPEYEYSWAVGQGGPNEHVVQVTIKQTQTQTLYEMPIDLKFIFDDGKDTTVTVQNNQFTQDYQFSFNKKPVQLIFDPQDWILDKHKETSPNTYISGEGFYRVYPNPSTGPIHIDLVYWKNIEIPLQIFDLHGRLVQTIKPERKIFNLYQYTWDGTNRSGQLVSSGIYFLTPQNVHFKKNVQKLIITR